MYSSVKIVILNLLFFIVWDLWHQGGSEHILDHVYKLSWNSVERKLSKWMEFLFSENVPNYGEEAKKGSLSDLKVFLNGILFHSFQMSSGNLCFCWCGTLLR